MVIGFRTIMRNPNRKTSFLFEIRHFYKKFDFLPVQKYNNLKCLCGGIGIHGRLRACALIGVLVRVQSEASFPDLSIIRRPKGQMVPYPFGHG